MDSFDLSVIGHEGHSLREKVYIRLRRDILAGKYKNHEELRENTIAKEYEVSRTPVREAMRQLELEGLVSSIPNKGTYVNRMDKKDVQDIYAIRSLLEGLCARWAAENATEAQIEAMEEVMVMARYHCSKGNDSQVCECDSRFHEMLYRASNSRMLDHLLKDFHEYLQIVRRYSLENGDRAKQSVKEHEAIVEAIRAKDPGKAEQLASAHIQNTVKNLEAAHFEEVI